MLRCQIEITNGSELRWQVLEQSPEWYEPWPVGAQCDNSAHAVVVKDGYASVQVLSLGGPEVRVSSSNPLRVWLYLRGNRPRFDILPSVVECLGHSEAIQAQRSIVTALVAVGRRLGLNVEVTC